MVLKSRGRRAGKIGIFAPFPGTAAGHLAKLMPANSITAGVRFGCLRRHCSDECGTREASRRGVEYGMGRASTLPSRRTEGEVAGRRSLPMGKFGQDGALLLRIEDRVKEESYQQGSINTCRIISLEIADMKW